MGIAREVRGMWSSRLALFYVG